MVLTHLPNRRISSIQREVEVFKCTDDTVQLSPEINPRWELANVHESADMSLHVVVGEKSLHADGLAAWGLLSRQAGFNLCTVGLQLRFNLCRVALLDTRHDRVVFGVDLGIVVTDVVYGHLDLLG